VKVGDVGTELVFIIRDQDGKVVDLSQAVSVTLVMRLGDTRLERTCDILPPASEGRVRYRVAAGDLASAGSLYMEVRVQFADGRTFTSNRITQVVEERL